MITIQSAMLVLLGFLVASLLVLLIAPAYRARVARLAVDRIKSTMPLTDTEIRADKDRLRAEYAIKIHTLMLQAEQAKAAAARQMIEVNRREATISALQGDIRTLEARIDEAENGRRVLEQTIRDRLPTVEARLAEARKLIVQRDHELAVLTAEAERTRQALDEARQINTQQQSEIQRNKTTMLVQGATSRQALADPAFDSEVAVRAELELLRAQCRDQAALIKAIQASGRDGAEPAAALEIERTRRDLAEAEAALKSVRETQTSSEAHAAVVTKLQAELDERAAEVRRLKAELDAYRNASESHPLSVRDSKIAMRARLSSLQSQVETQTEQIQRLRAELASANDRLARQAAHYVDELRRLGAGTVPASLPGRSRPDAGRISVIDRISQVDAALADEVRALRRPAPDAPKGGGAADSGWGSDNAGSAKSNGLAARTEPPAAEASSVAPANAKPNDAAGADGVPASEPVVPAVNPRKPRLLERLADLAKS